MMDTIYARAAQINPNAPLRKYREADDEYQLRCEARAQEVFFKALAEFRSKIQDAAILSSLMTEDFKILLDALSDHAPKQEYWDEKISSR